MSFLTGSHKAQPLPAPTPIPPPPTIDDAAQNARKSNEARQKRGAAATSLAGNDPATPPTAIAKLLGQ